MLTKRADRLPRLCLLGQLITFILVAAIWRVDAQGTTTTLTTGGGQPLVTAERRVMLPAGMAVLTLDFGFATDELFAPGQFLDSFTLTIQDLNSGMASILVTADASGFVWAPPTPGGVAINDASIARQPIPFPSLQPMLANSMAYEISFILPPEFQAGSVNVIFDLFDNQDALDSLGYFSEIRVVPEPSIGVLLICGALLGIFWSRHRTRHIK